MDTDRRVIEYPTDQLPGCLGRCRFQEPATQQAIVGKLERIAV